MTSYEQVATWLAGVGAAAVAALGLRLKNSEVNRKVARNNAEAEHSSGLPDDIRYWRSRAERGDERIHILELERAALDAKVALRDERIERLQQRCDRLTEFVIKREPALAVWLKSEPGDLSNPPELQPKGP